MSFISQETSSNPVFQDQRFKANSNASDGIMTIEGTLNKSAMCFALLMLTAYYSWSNPNPVLILSGTILGLIAAIITMFKKNWSPYTVPAYALLEGLALGGISQVFETKYPGIAGQAIFLTFAVLALMLSAYRLEWIRATPKFKKVIVMATMAIGLLYLVNMGMSFFGSEMSFIRGASPIGIGFSVVVVGIASLNLILDFDFIEKSSKRNLPQYMEWFAAFGLLVTLIWLYLEILRLLSKLKKK